MSDDDVFRKTVATATRDSRYCYHQWQRALHVTVADTVNLLKTGKLNQQ